MTRALRLTGHDGRTADIQRCQEEITVLMALAFAEGIAPSGGGPACTHRALIELSMRLAEHRPPTMAAPTPGTPFAILVEHAGRLVRSCGEDGARPHVAILDRHALAAFACALEPFRVGAGR